jgi:S-(hydroxymethyl)glutathione dehydrogenase/alcohol dehydrogenase
MKAAVLYAYGEPLKVEDVDLESPKAGEVKVKIEATGVCHSDLSARNGTLGFPAPMIPGHEAAGTIVELGSGVTRVKEGDRVIVRWIPSCEECWYCTHGEPIYCQQVNEHHGLMTDFTSRLSVGGTPLFHGLDAATFAEEVVLNEKAVVKIDDDVPFDVAALVGCAVGTGVGAVLNTCKVPAGSTVAVIGCGGIGLNVIQGARIAECDQIIAVDVVASKLEAARKFGATDVVDASSTAGPAAVLELTGGRGADYAFEAIGNLATQQQAVDMTRRGGVAVMVGVSPIGEMLPVHTWNLTLTGRSIIGCFFGSMVVPRDFPKLFDYWRAGKLDLEGLISNKGTLEDINSAFEAMESGSVLRTVINP